MRVTVEDDGTVVIEQVPGAAKAEVPSSSEASGLAGVVVKSDSPRRYTLTVAYPADKPDVSVAADGHRDFASKDAVEEAAWSYLHKSPMVGLWHKEGTDGAGDVVESYIYRGPDWTITAVDGSTQLIKAGDWLMGIRWNEQTWPLVEKGLIGGVSPQGRARRREPSEEALSALR